MTTEIKKETFELAPFDIIDGDRGKNYPKQFEFFDEGFCLFLNTGNVTSNGFNFEKCSFISKEKDGKLRKGKLKRNDIVLTTRGTIGNTSFYNNRIPYNHVRINSGMVILRPKETINPRYLYLFVRSSSFLNQVKTLRSGSAQPQLPIKDMNRIEIPLPPLTIQQKIAGMLSAYDDLIENNSRRIKILEEMAQTIYREWFVNFRFPGHEKVKMVDSELGMIPEGWEVKQIGEAVETLGGGTPSTKKPEYWDAGEIMWFTPSDLTANGNMFIAESGKKISRLGLHKSSARMFPAYSVMMTSRATIGVVSINTTPACTNQGFITCIPNDHVSAFQLYFWLKDNKELITQVASGATYKEINRTEFRQLPLIMADGKVSRRFAKLIQPLGREIEVLLGKNNILCCTRDLLLPKLISGELDVSELDIEIGKENT